MRNLLTSLLIIFLCACGADETNVGSAKTGKPVEDWHLSIQLPDTVLPVQLHMKADGSEAWFVNGAEKVMVPEVSKDGDLWRLHFSTFNNTVMLKQQDRRLLGTLTVVRRGYEQVMEVSGEPYSGFRFHQDPVAERDFTGRWEVLFTDDDGKESIAIGEFDQQGGQVTGTFLTPLGDYRYLQGDVEGDTMYLSTFDGAHAFVFSARMLADGTLEGDFWSGTRWHERWVASKNFDAKLPDAYSLTYLKEGYEKLEFSFPDLDGKPVSLLDESYSEKVVLVTLSGTWCPNCADEMEFLSNYFRENRQRGLEVVTLLYERVDTFEAAVQLGRALRAKHGIEYELLIAGTSEKDVASESLPMLNRVIAYPTIIFIDRNATVRRIHTGFSGPGTGRYYSDFMAEFTRFMDELLGEEPAH